LIAVIAITVAVVGRISIHCRHDFLLSGIIVPDYTGFTFIGLPFFGL